MTATSSAISADGNFSVVGFKDGDVRLYFDAFAIKVSPEMKTKPFKAYQTGGLVVNIFA